MKGNFFDSDCLGEIDEEGGIPLRFTPNKVRKVIEYILYDMAHSDQFINRNFEQPSVHEEEDDLIRLSLTPNKEIKNELDRLFGRTLVEPDHPEYGYVDWISLNFLTRYDKWFPKRGRRKLCSRNYFISKFHDENFDNCPCPSELEGACRTIVSALKKYTLEDHTRKYPRKKLPF